MNDALIDRILELMNEAFAADPVAIQNMVETRFACNDELGDHPTIQCGVRSANEVNILPSQLAGIENNDKVTTVGLLGILNGIAGIREDGIGYVCAAYETVDGGLGPMTGFERTPQHTPREPT